MNCQHCGKQLTEYGECYTCDHTECISCGTVVSACYTDCQCGLCKYTWSLDEYKNAKERLKNGEKKILEVGGFTEAPESWVKAFKTIAEQCLMYEIHHDLLPI